MIAAAREGHPELSVRRLCALLGVNRAWYYAQQREDLSALAEAMRLRDAVERLALDFDRLDPATGIAGCRRRTSAGDGDFRGKRRSSATAGTATTSASCG